MDNRIIYRKAIYRYQYAPTKQYDTRRRRNVLDLTFLNGFCLAKQRILLMFWENHMQNNKQSRSKRYFGQFRLCFETTSMIQHARCKRKLKYCMRITILFLIMLRMGLLPEHV